MVQAIPVSRPPYKIKKILSIFTFLLSTYVARIARIILHNRKSYLHDTRNPDHKKRSKKWSSLNRACFVQSFLIFHPSFGLVFLDFLRVSSRFLLFLLLMLLMCRKAITKWAMAKKLANL